ncbi:MAG: hypothetical protein U1E77_18610 [Inhella sp.]
MYLLAVGRADQHIGTGGQLEVGEADLDEVGAGLAQPSFDAALGLRRGLRGGLAAGLRGRQAEFNADRFGHLQGLGLEGLGGGGKGRKARGEREHHGGQFHGLGFV